MNKYFETSDQYISNKRIIEAYFTEAEQTASPLKKGYEALLSFLLSILACLTSTAAKRVYLLSSVALCIVGFFGLVGAVERGALSMIAALLIALVLLGFEVLCLKRIAHEE